MIDWGYTHMTFAEQDVWLRSAGCKCEKRIYAWRSGVGPRCPSCGTVAAVPTVWLVGPEVPAQKKLV